MPKISTINARQIFDSRGFPTIEATVALDNGISTASSVPSGLSKSSYEALELRDGGGKFGGLGVERALQAVNSTIAPKLIGLDVFEQQMIDKTMIDLDGTQNKASLGANSILSVSQAVFKAGAKASSRPLYSYIAGFLTSGTGIKVPTPMFNILEGGKHGANLINFQEFLVIPATSKSFAEGFEIGVAAYHSLRKMLKESNKSILVADEGGFSPELATNLEGLTLAKDAIENSGYSFSLDAFLGLDCAASTFFEKDKYKLVDRPEPYKVSDLIDYYLPLISDFSLIYIEDPFAEDDDEGWKKFASSAGSKILVVGDDLTSTNPFRLQAAINNKVLGGIIIKPNQIGTISEAIAVVEIAKYTKLKVIVSHRSGETEDDFIADFAVGIGADYVKFGAPARERVVKYNRLFQIESELKKS